MKIGGDYTFFRASIILRYKTMYHISIFFLLIEALSSLKIARQPPVSFMGFLKHKIHVSDFGGLARDVNLAVSSMVIFLSTFK